MRIEQRAEQHLDNLVALTQRLDKRFQYYDVAARNIEVTGPRPAAT